MYGITIHNFKKYFFIITKPPKVCEYKNQTKYWQKQNDLFSFTILIKQLKQLVWILIQSTYTNSLLN